MRWGEKGGTHENELDSDGDPPGDGAGSVTERVVDGVGEEAIDRRDVSGCSGT